MQSIWFGDEVEYPTPLQETLEHCDLYRALFPLDRDLGLKITLLAPQKTIFYGLKLDFGVVTGDGINPTTDGNLNFIGHLKYNRTIKDIYFGLGCSLYAGSVAYREKILSGGTLVGYEKATNARTYYGFDAQVKFPTFLGTTEIKGEYVFGNQPSQLNSFRSPASNEYVAIFSSTPVFEFDIVRKFNGGYVYLYQDLGSLPLRMILKYTFLNPNTEKEKHIGFEQYEISGNTFGLGCMWNIMKGLCLTALYDINNNEKLSGVKGYSYDRKDNHFTMRLQYMF